MNVQRLDSLHSEHERQTIGNGLVKLACRTASLFFLLIVVTLVGTTRATAASAEAEKPAEPVPVWLYDAQSFEFWRDDKGNYQGLYPMLVKLFN